MDGLAQNATNVVTGTGAWQSARVGLHIILVPRLVHILHGIADQMQHVVITLILIMSIMLLIMVPAATLDALIYTLESLTGSRNFLSTTMIEL